MVVWIAIYVSITIVGKTSIANWVAWFDVCCPNVTHWSAKWVAWLDVGCPNVTHWSANWVSWFDVGCLNVSQLHIVRDVFLSFSFFGPEKFQSEALNFGKYYRTNLNEKKATVFFRHISKPCRRDPLRNLFWSSLNQQSGKTHKSNHEFLSGD